MILRGVSLLTNAIAGLTFWAACALQAAQQPNVILILTDDQGYGDISAHGNPDIRTPNLDQLHAESVRLTDFHVDPTCAPTRGALMSGKYSHRARVWHTVRGGNHLRASEVTMADVFKHNGYQTAMFGKWHLGANYPYRPMDRGFDEWLGLGDGGPGTSDDYFWNDRVDDTYWHNGVREYREGYNPDVFFDGAIDYVKNREAEAPFFIYLPTYVPHKPKTLPNVAVAEAYMKEGIPKDRAFFYAMIDYVDQGVARLRKGLEDAGVADDTILIFMTDNGSTYGRVSFNAGMAGGKGGTVDGGHRVPCFIHWPGGDLGQPRDVPTLAAHIDLLPTLNELCGLKLPQPIDLDGQSLAPVLRDEDVVWPDRILFVEKQRNVERTPSDSAIMTQKWRLVGHKKLYDIKNDPGQKTDLSKKYPEVVERLLQAFDQHWARVTVDDRSYPTPIAGAPYDEELLLSFSELRAGRGFEHGHSAQGNPVEDVWHLEIAEAGMYAFEVSRWPTEADATMTGVPEVTKVVDSYGDNGERTHLLYGGTFSSLPITSVSLAVGDFREERAVTTEDKSLIFNVKLPAGKTTVDAVFYDESGEILTKAYYVYVRKK